MLDLCAEKGEEGQRVLPALLDWWRAGIVEAEAADHHIQNVYTKIRVSTRAAAALWAMQHALVG